MVSAIKKFPCKIKNCKSSFKTIEGLKSHSKTAHEIPIKCPRKDCNSFVKPYCVKQHIRNVHDKIRQSCDHCGKQTVNAKRHLESCIGDKTKKIHCTEDNCRSSFISDQGLKDHIRNVHVITKLVECPRENCGRQLKPYSLRQHIKRVHESPARAQQCTNCGKFVMYLQNHLQRCTSNGERKFKCPVKECNASFTVQNSVSAHVRVVHKSPVKCPHKDCDAIVKPVYLTNHIKSVHDKIKQTCQNCGKKVIRLRKHVESCMSDGVKRFSCTQEGCKSSFTTETHLKEHARVVHTPLIKCPHKDCKSLIKRCSLNNHMKYIHDKCTRNCEYCGKRLLSYYMESHMEKCIGKERKFRCKVRSCKMSFDSAYGLSRHEDKFHKPLVTCLHEGCDIILRPYDLTKHIRLAHGNENKICKNCGKEVRCLIPHYERCTADVARYNCAIKGCQASFAMRYDLNTHVRSVHTEPVKCPRKKCGKFMKVAYLKRHLESCTDSDIRQYRCKIGKCKAAFKAERHLTIHLRAVHAEPVKCPRRNCGAYVKPANLRSHIRNIHEK